jgi:hypothetical protein
MIYRCLSRLLFYCLAFNPRRTAEAGIYPQNPKIAKVVGNDEEERFPSPAFTLAHRSATARKRGDTLHGNDYCGEQEYCFFPNYELLSHVLVLGYLGKRNDNWNRSPQSGPNSVCSTL